MPTLQEILAAKKTGTPVPTIAPATVSAKEVQPDGTVTDVDPTDKGIAVVKTIAEPIKEEPAVNAAPKALSFAEKMALKKLQENGQQPVSSASTPQSSESIKAVEGNVEAVKTTQTPPVLAAESPVAQPVSIPASGVTTAAVSASPEAAQAYADIKSKLATLNEMAGTDLESAMKDLKKALMANPAAVSLMEDTDIGQMVIALRRLTGEAITEAAKEKKVGRKPKTKDVDLSDPDVVQAVFDEL